MELLNNNKRIRLDRIQSIFKMHELKQKNREIARKVGCSPSTISDVLNVYKHPVEEVWESMTCYEKAKYVFDKQKAKVRNKNRRKGNIKDKRKREYVERRLIEDEWSPEIISAEMKKDINETISTSTIYRYIKYNRPSLRKYLYRKGKVRKQRVAHRRGTLRQKQKAEKTYIDQRPEEVNARLEFGHWEGDLMLGPKKGSGYVVLSLIERKSRLKEFIRMPYAKAETTLAYLRAFFESLPPEARKSLTLDNGSEFSIFYMKKLEQLFPKFKIYYTETYSPEQKGSVEHSNGRFRRNIPKGTDFALVPKELIKFTKFKLNNRPMKLHRYETPQQIFNLELKSALELASTDSLTDIRAVA